MEIFKKVRIASILGMLGNIFLFIIKSLVGFITKSQAMMADAFNSLTDIFSSIMTFIGNKIASKPSDEDHNLGHRKAEYIFSMLISVVMFLLALNIFKEVIESFLFKERSIFSIWLVIVCIITIIIKLFLYLYTKKIAKEYNNLLIEANSKDHRNDCVITFFNLVSAFMSLNGIYFIDSIVGIGISIWIIISALEIFKTSFDVLMDKSINRETQKKVLDIIKLHDEIKQVNHFNSTPVGYQYQISFTIFVDGNLSTFESHAIADHLEDEINNKIPEIYLTVIHVNPIKIKNKKRAKN